MLDELDATAPPFVPSELVRSSSEAAETQGSHRMLSLQHRLCQRLAEAEAEMLIEAEVTAMCNGDLGTALRGPLGVLEQQLKEDLERHRAEEVEAAKEALVMLSSQLESMHGEQMKKQAEVLAFIERRAEAKLKAARRAAQTRLDTTTTALERKFEARLAEAAAQHAAELEEARRLTKTSPDIMVLLESQAKLRVQLEQTESRRRTQEEASANELRRRAESHREQTAQRTVQLEQQLTAQLEQARQDHEVELSVLKSMLASARQEPDRFKDKLASCQDKLSAARAEIASLERKLVLQQEMRAASWGGHSASRSGGQTLGES